MRKQLPPDVRVPEEASQQEMKYLVSSASGVPPLEGGVLEANGRKLAGSAGLADGTNKTLKQVRSDVEPSLAEKRAQDLDLKAPPSCALLVLQPCHAGLRLKDTGSAFHKLVDKKHLVTLRH